VNLTQEQSAVAQHPGGAFVEACPGSGKTAAIVARVGVIGRTLGSNRGLAVLSFTNSAIDEFSARCRADALDSVLRFPCFVNTFDGFLRHFLFAPGGVQGVSQKPVVVDSWDTLGIEIRLSGPNAFALRGPSLDLFSAEDNRIDPDVIGMQALRDHVARHLAAYQQVAARRRAVLRNRGYFSAADVRVEIVHRLRRVDWSAAMSRAVAARFVEVVIDEGQDCNPLDCEIISWLRNAGIAVTVVADPDQAIYGFRHGAPADLRAIANSYAAVDRLTLTGNFRSGPPICAVAASLRQRADPDRSLEDAAQFLEPLQVLSYPGRVSSDIGAFFLDRLRTAGMSVSNSLVLAHARRNALRACGSGGEEDGGTSNVARLAGAVGALWGSSTSSRGRERALSIAEHMILDLMGSISEGEQPVRAAERRNIDRRWLRRTAFALLTGVPRSCDDTDAARRAWLGQLHDRVRALRLTYRHGTSERRYFQSRGDATWNRCLVDADVECLAAATVHEAKGKQYDAICLVIPPDVGGSTRTQRLIDSWENRTDDEAKRVVYVGITRARRLAVLAIPEAVRERISRLLDAARADYRLHSI
jgi:DNA helicase II / ATP-dependent DNA helicase PcrA